MTPVVGACSIIVKVCGVTSANDALGCVEAGVDWIGLNFVAGSKRRIDLARAHDIVEAVGHRVVLVAVVADPSDDLVRQLCDLGIDRIQLHGDETPARLEAIGKVAFKAVRVGDAADLPRARTYPGLILVDAKVEGQLGGTGRKVDRTLAATLARERPVVLAGGLDADSVGDAVRAVQPYGVDVASGVERAPGVKDLDAVRRFVHRARQAGGASTAGVEAPGRRH